MSILGLLLEGAWHVLLAGLILGAGIPVVFALGIRAWSWGASGVDTAAEHHPHLVAKLLAGLCLLIVLAAVAFGIAIIVSHGFGLEVQFGWPLFVPR